MMNSCYYCHSPNFVAIFKMEAHSQGILNLTCTQVSVEQIMEIVGCSRVTIFNVRKRFKEKGTAGKRPGSSGQNLKRTDNFLGGIRGKVKALANTSMRFFAPLGQQQLPCDVVL